MKRFPQQNLLEYKVMSTAVQKLLFSRDVLSILYVLCHNCHNTIKILNGKTY